MKNIKSTDDHRTMLSTGNPAAMTELLQTEEASGAEPVSIARQYIVPIS